jgi:hypothetical protein
MTHSAVPKASASMQVFALIVPLVTATGEWPVLGFTMW